MRDRRGELGMAGESLAACHLERGGWRIAARNARTRFGELDLIALDGPALVFVEVKARYGGPADAEAALASIGPRKQLRIRRLARAWLAGRPALPRFDEIRFDAIGIAVARDRSASWIAHVRQAF